MNAYEYQQFVNELENLSVDVSKVVSSIREPMLISTARTFARNIENLSCLSDLPHIVSLHTIMQAFRLSFVTLERFAEVVSQASGKKSASGQQPDESAGEFVSALFGNMEFYKNVIEWRKTIFDELLTSDANTRASMQQVLYSISSQLWTAFEVMSRDLWVTTVNLHPAGLVQHIARVTDEKSASKHISIHFLAKYNFDVKEHMGTLLAPKFDFDAGIRAIRRAFETIFPDRVTELQTLIRYSELHYLEEVRHLIVHTAGVVDADFISHTNSTAAEGEPLLLEPATVLKMADASVRSGCNLLQFVDSWLSQER